MLTSLRSCEAVYIFIHGIITAILCFGFVNKGAAVMITFLNTVLHCTQSHWIYLTEKQIQAVYLTFNNSINNYCKGASIGRR